MRHSGEVAPFGSQVSTRAYTERIRNHKSVSRLLACWAQPPVQVNPPRHQEVKFRTNFIARATAHSGLWFGFLRLANREQENGTLAFRMRRKEASHVIVEEGQPGRTQALGIRSQIHPAADCPRLQLDGPVAAVPV